jgi:phosphatidate cytidylyltransferase
MESSSGRGRGERPEAFDRDLDVDLDFDPFGGREPPPPRAESGLDVPGFVREPEVEEAPAAPPPRPERRARPRRQPRALRRPRSRPRRPGRGGRPPRPGSETVARILWAVPWIVAVVAVIVVGGLLFAAAAVALASIALIELFRMARAEGAFQIVAIVVTAGMAAAAYYGDQYQIVLALACMFPLMFIAVATRPSLEGVTRSLAITALGVLWIGLPFAHAVLLRELPVHGGALLVDVLVGTFVCDTAAYAGGRLFGRHQLAPSLSPSKTVEGLAFGFVGGTLGFWFAGLYQDWLPGLDALVIGAVVAAVAPVGDLFESMIKRDLGAKDSGNVFGPHGGMLDRVDAALFTLVAGYYLSVAFLY